MWASWRYLACMACSILHLDFIWYLHVSSVWIQLSGSLSSRLSGLRSFEWGGRQKTGASVGNKCLAWDKLWTSLNSLVLFAYAIHVLFLLTFVQILLGADQGTYRSVRFALVQILLAGATAGQDSLPFGLHKPSRGHSNWCACDYLIIFDLMIWLVVWIFFK